MTQEQNRQNNQARSQANHEEFQELCALAASGNLGEAEEAKLRDHLSYCADCRQALTEFESIASGAISELGTESIGDLPAHSTFSLDEVKGSFEKRLAEERAEEGATRSESRGPVQRAVPQRPSVLRRFDGYDLWLPLAASLLLCATLGILSYRTGRNHGVEWARKEGAIPQTEVASGETPSQPGASVLPTNEALASRDADIAHLRLEIEQKSSELRKLKAREAENETRLGSSAQDKNHLGEENRKLIEQRDRLAREASAQEATLRETRERLKLLEEERSGSAIQTASLESRVRELTDLLDDRDKQTAQQADLLEKDRDIRELIGARDLYITEIYDVLHNGDTRKAAGRVFYTKGKSLIFYAYDLNENPGVRDASTFEAWGQRGSDWHQASKLGIFYEDNANKKRWVVKSNDRKTLEQLDAVFITIEPNGGSDRPTGKPMLFAYLKVSPNHP